MASRFILLMGRTVSQMYILKLELEREVYSETYSALPIAMSVGA